MRWRVVREDLSICADRVEKGVVAVHIMAQAAVVHVQTKRFELRAPGQAKRSPLGIVICTGTSINGIKV